MSWVIQEVGMAGCGDPDLETRESRPLDPSGGSVGRSGGGPARQGWAVQGTGTVFISIPRAAGSPWWDASSHTYLCVPRSHLLGNLMMG